MRIKFTVIFDARYKYTCNDRDEAESHGMKKVNYHSEAITIILVTELMIA